AARAAKQNGATRFCMGAAWRGPKQRDLEQVAERVRAVKALGLETCATLGLLREGQAEELQAAGLDCYNHNLDTATELHRRRTTVRLSAGRAEMPEAVQALCFLAGANSIFYGDKLLTTGNPEAARDRALLEKLGIRPA